MILLPVFTFICVLIHSSCAFSPERGAYSLARCHQEARTNEEESHLLRLSSRRAWVQSQLVTVVATASMCTLQPNKVEAAVMSSGDQVFKLGEDMSIDQAKKRFQLARKDIQYLLANYSEISKEGGDAVRRYLGTVGTTGYMYGIGKILKLLRDEAEDIVEYTETMDEFNAYLYQAEGAAYQAIFAEHSSAKSSPEDCLKTAEKDIQMMDSFFDKLEAQLRLD